MYGIPQLLAKNKILYFDDGLKLKDGRPTPYFLDFGKCNNGHGRIVLGSILASHIVDNKLDRTFDVVFAPAYKAIGIADALVDVLYWRYSINKYVDYDRKEAKTHGEGSKKASRLVNNSLYDGCRVLIIDDVLSSSKTKEEVTETIEAAANDEKIKADVAGVLVIVNREQKTLEGKNPIDEFVSKTGIPIYCFSGIKNIVEELYQIKEPVLVKNEMKRFDDKLKKEFDDYMKKYGV